MRYTISKIDFDVEEESLLRVYGSCDYPPYAQIRLYSHIIAADAPRQEMVRDFLVDIFMGAGVYLDKVDKLRDTIATLIEVKLNGVIS